MLGQQSHSQYLHNQLFLQCIFHLACNGTFPKFCGIIMCEIDLKQLLPPASLQVPNNKN